MVFFTCSFCNESIKKKQVEKHLIYCRRCNALSCVDCGKEFTRESYKAHIKCISEDEKYSGPNYRPRAAANKGERKQEEWCNQVQAAIESCKPDHKQVHQILMKIKDSTNVPRKQAKFHNFVRNHMRVWSPIVIEEAWTLINTPISPTKTAKPIPLADIEEKKNAEEENNSVTNGKKRKAEDSVDEDKEEESKNKSKKRKKNKKEKKDKLEEVENGDTVENSPLTEQNIGRLNATLDSEILVRPDKFNWITTITNLINKKKGEISLKKLRKKTLAEFLNYPEADKINDAKIGAKFDKIIRKNFKLEDKYVQLAEIDVS